MLEVDQVRQGHRRVRDDQRHVPVRAEAQHLVPRVAGGEPEGPRPRIIGYHQLEAVRMLVDAAGREGVGHNYLVEHSAGSGKSNTIGWLTHRLASLHDAANERVFDSVIVVTDRVVLDQQLQDTVYQFEHKRGVVQRIDDSSRQLAEALENRVPVIITTLQKFPFVSRQLLKMAEERGTTGSGTLATRRCAVVVDEAHSSQGGETATDLKEVLGGETLRQEAQKRATEEGREDLAEVFRSMAKRGKQANLSFFAFTATPKCLGAQLH